MTGSTKNTYGWFADQLLYPSGRPNSLHYAPAELRKTPNTVNAEILLFEEKISRFESGEIEELYTRTFDVNPISSLEVGWHLYGEQYERGAFLVTMRELLRNYGIVESTELPDHLTHVLLLIGAMPGAERADFVARLVRPAMRKILEGFKDQENPYAHLLKAIEAQLNLEIPEGETAHE